jgi:CMP-N-acetylneuraminic acid synthetase
MADPQQIEQELRDFLSMEDNIRKSDRLAALMAIINKHFELDKIDHIVIHYDLEQIISHAKSSFATMTLPVVISRKQVHETEVRFILLMESFAGYLNKNKLLKRLVKFDYRR